MATSDEIYLRRGERGFLGGKTGSGKSALAEKLCAPFPFVVALDPKLLLGFDNDGNRVSWLDYKRVTTQDAVFKAHREGVRKIIYAPNPIEFDGPNAAAYKNRFFEWVFKCGHWMLYVDELTMVGERDQIPFWYRACYRQGRQHGITTLTGTQRPTGIAGVIKSEAERAWIFHLQLEQDRENVERTWGLDADSLKPENLKKHQFFYLREGQNARGPLILDPKLFGGK